MKLAILEENTKATKELVKLKSKQDEHEEEENFSNIPTEKQDENKSSYSFKLEDEKDTGWINFGILQAESLKASYTLPQQTENATPRLKPEKFVFQDSPLFSPLSPVSVASSRRDLFPRFTTILPTAESPKRTTTLRWQKSMEQSFHSKEEFTTEHNNNNKKVAKKKSYVNEGSVAASQLTKGSKKDRLSIIYVTALTQKHYPKILNALIYFFYFGLLALLVAQFILKISVDNNISLLSAKKNILRNAQLSNFDIVQCAGAFRILENLESGRLTSAELGAFELAASGYIDFISQAFSALSQSVQECI